MRRPTKVLVWIGLFLAAVMGVAVLLAEPLQEAFMANPIFNGMILTVLVVGIIINLRQVVMLGPDAAWIRAYKASRVTQVPPKRGVLGSLVTLLTERADDQRLRFSPVSSRALLDSVRSRLEESRDLTRYFIGLLIFLGLLGTFWGLLDTLRAIGEVIRDMRITGTDATGVFDELRAGLEAPLSGMGTAFSSSLFGLSGALVLGFVDLQAGHAQNRFYNDLEEWLSTVTQYGSGGIGGSDGDTTIPAYIQALLEQTADSLDRLQRAMARGEEERRSADRNIMALTEQVASLAEHTRSEQKAILNMVRGSTDLQPVLSRLAESLDRRGADQGEMVDVLNRLEQETSRMVQTMQNERGDMAERLAEEVRLLTRTIARQRDDDR
ncbi:hypothetical protein J2T57_000340 [Natronocella acetinitrilica]|uniref:Flagellar motor protein MotA n=1 Tax=Natronocella acetinitrilica TaxID=414046 RepID=A0AAE3KB73_9GAMM|nr:flagellar motor protein MotA [Natronocella acetinitrilica]MCP1673248.1 hypothetical protein [Natronocella acetinitrilica]